MLAFENETLRLFDQLNIKYDFDDRTHYLKSAKISIQFIPNLTYPELFITDKAKPDDIYLWQDIFENRGELVKSRIQSLLGGNITIHGRETVLSDVSPMEYQTFLNKNHLMGSTKAKHRMGLRYKNQLVAVAGFGRSCPIDYRGEVYKSNELIRFCNNKGVTVVGGLSKLIKYFIRQEKPQHLMTYVDKEWSNGANYTKMGFELIGSTEPEQFWISPKDGIRYRKKELETMSVQYDHWARVVNLGSYKFIKIIA